MSVCLFICLPVSVCVCLSVCVYVSGWVSLCASVYLSACVCLCFDRLMYFTLHQIRLWDLVEVIPSLSHLKKERKIRELDIISESKSH